jgi:hypothetical protein
MPKSRTILALGFFIALLPVLGFPQAWESFFEVASGLLIVFLSVLISVDRRLTMKSKAEKRHLRKRALIEAQSANQAEASSEPIHYGRRATDRVPEEPKPVYNRRATDRRVPVKDGDSLETPPAENIESPEF